MMTKKQIEEFLAGEYDSMKQTGVCEYECTLEYIEETHKVSIEGSYIYALYNGRKWLIN